VRVRSRSFSAIEERASGNPAPFTRPDCLISQGRTAQAIRLLKACLARLERDASALVDRYWWAVAEELLARRELLPAEVRQVIALAATW
jgi:hypothetical protein